MQLARIIRKIRCKLNIPYIYVRENPLTYCPIIYCASCGCSVGGTFHPLKEAEQEELHPFVEGCTCSLCLGDKLIDQIVLKPHVDSFINEHCDNCIQKSHYILDNYYLSKQMRGIIKDANHDAIYMMHYFAKEAEQE